MKILSSAIGALLLLGTGLSAQAQPGEFVVTAYANTVTNTTGGLFVANGAGGTVTDLKATGDLRNSYSIATDPYDDTAFWVGTRRATTTTAPAIYRVVAVAGRILSTVKLGVTLTSADVTVYQVRVWGHRLLFLTETQLASVPLIGGKASVLLTFNSTTGVPSNFACDGRNLFVHMQPKATLLAEHIVRVDMEAPQTRTTIYQANGITYFIPSLTLDTNGDLLITESEAFSGVSTIKVLDTLGRNLRTVNLPFTHGVAGASMDSSGSIVVVAGMTYDTVNKRTVTGFITLLAWTVFKTQFGTSPERFTHIDVRGHRSLHRYGHVCESGKKWRADISATGLPKIGNTNYSISVRGIANANAMLLVGAHGAMPVPFPLWVMGAGTCELGVQPLISVPVRLSGNGTFTLLTPIPATASAGNVDVQWLIAETGANPAGFVSSQVGSIVIR